MNNDDLKSPIIRASGIYDAVILLPFAIPGVASFMIAKLRMINEALSLSGSIPEIPAIGMLFLNQMATIALLYSVLRIKQPNRFYGSYDVIGRTLMGILLVFYLLVYKVAGVVWLFVGPEIFWAILQYRAITKNK